MASDWGPITSRTVDLGYEQLLVLESKPGTRVRVLIGHLWLTEEGSAQDVFASSGDEVSLRSRGTAVLQGQGMVRVELIERARHSWVAALWRSASQWLRQRRLAHRPSSTSTTAAQAARA